MLPSEAIQITDGVAIAAREDVDLRRDMNVRRYEGIFPDGGSSLWRVWSLFQFIVRMVMIRRPSERRGQPVAFVRVEGKILALNPRLLDIAIGYIGTTGTTFWVPTEDGSPYVIETETLPSDLPDEIKDELPSGATGLYIFIAPSLYAETNTRLGIGVGLLTLIGAGGYLYLEGGISGTCLSNITLDCLISPVGLALYLIVAIIIIFVAVLTETGF